MDRERDRFLRSRRKTPLHPAGGLVRQQEEPWTILTGLPPDEVGVSWYALRFWTELGFRAVKSLGWQWQKTRRTDPARISRHWFVEGGAAEGIGDVGWSLVAYAPEGAVQVKVGGVDEAKYGHGYLVLRTGILRWDGPAG